MRWCQDDTEDRTFINHDEVVQVIWKGVDMEIGVGIRNFVWDRLILVGCFK